MSISSNLTFVFFILFLIDAAQLDQLYVLVADLPLFLFFDVWSSIPFVSIAAVLVKRNWERIVNVWLLSLMLVIVFWLIRLRLLKLLLGQASVWHPPLLSCTIGWLANSRGSFTLASLAHFFSLCLNLEQIDQTFGAFVRLVPEKERKVALIDTIPHEVCVGLLLCGRRALRWQALVVGNLRQFLTDALLVAGHLGQVGYVWLSLLVHKPGEVKLFVHFALGKL